MARREGYGGRGPTGPSSEAKTEVRRTAVYRSCPDAGISSALDYTEKRVPSLRPLTDEFVRVAIVLPRVGMLHKRQRNGTDATNLYIPAVRDGVELWTR